MNLNYRGLIAVIFVLDLILMAMNLYERHLYLGIGFIIAAFCSLFIFCTWISDT